MTEKKLSQFDQNAFFSQFVS